jgi:hypothetical protein
MLDTISSDLAYDIISDTKEYQSAKWD